MAYRLLTNSAVLSKVCNVPEILITKLLNIWIALVSMQPLIPEKVQNYCEETWKLFKREVWWHPGLPREILSLC